MMDSPQLNNSFFPASQPAEAACDKYIVFCLGTDFFAVATNKVSEVVQMLSVTRLPCVPEWLLGIADLRGGIISVVNLPKLLGKTDANLSPKNKFIVLNSQNFPSNVALAVDKLSEILFLSNEEIQITENENAPYLLGKAEYKLKPLSLINVENLLASLTV